MQNLVNVKFHVQNDLDVLSWSASLLFGPKVAAWSWKRRCCGKKLGKFKIFSRSQEFFSMFLDQKRRLNMILCEFQPWAFVSLFEKCLANCSFLSDHSICSQCHFPHLFQRKSDNENGGKRRAKNFKWKLIIRACTHLTDFSPKLYFHPKYPPNDYSLQDIFLLLQLLLFSIQNHLYRVEIKWKLWEQSLPLERVLSIDSNFSFMIWLFFA